MWYYFLYHKVICTCDMQYQHVSDLITCQTPLKSDWNQTRHRKMKCVYSSKVSDRPHPRTYPHTTTDYRHTDKWFSPERGDRWPVRQTVGHYQVHCLPRFSVNNYPISWIINLKGFAFCSADRNCLHKRKKYKRLHKYLPLLLTDHFLFRVNVTWLIPSNISA